VQHVLRWWERQFDGTEYNKTFRRPSRKPPSWWGGAGCPFPKNPSTALGPSGLASPTPTPKLVPTPLVGSGSQSKIRSPQKSPAAKIALIYGWLSGVLLSTPNLLTSREVVQVRADFFRAMCAFVCKLLCMCFASGVYPYLQLSYGHIGGFFIGCLTDILL